MSGVRRDFRAGGHRIVLIDSVTQVEAADAGAIVVTGSHGGTSAAGYAVHVRARLYVFNDAGIGKDEAGIAGLGLLADADIAAVAVAHDTARIGDAADTFSSGVLSSVNRPAHSLGMHMGQRVRDLPDFLTTAAP